MVGTALPNPLNPRFKLRLSRLRGLPSERFGAHDIASALCYDYQSVFPRVYYPGGPI